MSGFGRKLTREQEKQARRTRQGVCARCGKPPSGHSKPAMLCPDGSGRDYTWAFTRDGARALMSNLERALQPVDDRPLTPNEQRVVDLMCGRMLEGLVTTAAEASEALGLSLSLVREVFEALEAKGMIAKSAPPLS